MAGVTQLPLVVFIVIAQVFIGWALVERGWRPRSCRAGTCRRDREFELVLVADVEQVFGRRGPHIARRQAIRSTSRGPSIACPAWARPVMARALLARPLLPRSSLRASLRSASFRRAAFHRASFHRASFTVAAPATSPAAPATLAASFTLTGWLAPCGGLSRARRGQVFVEVQFAEHVVELRRRRQQVVVILLVQRALVQHTGRRRWRAGRPTSGIGRAFVAPSTAAAATTTPATPAPFAVSASIVAALIVVSRTSLPARLALGGFRRARIGWAGSRLFIEQQARLAIDVVVEDRTILFVVVEVGWRLGRRRRKRAALLSPIR